MTCKVHWAIKLSKPMMSMLSFTLPVFIIQSTPEEHCLILSVEISLFERKWDVAQWLPFQQGCQICMQCCLDIRPTYFCSLLPDYTLGLALRLICQIKYILPSRSISREIHHNMPRKCTINNSKSTLRYVGIFELLQEKRKLAL